jgi:hypothetical protein
MTPTHQRLAARHVRAARTVTADCAYWLRRGHAVAYLTRVIVKECEKAWHAASGATDVRRIG